MHLEEYNPDVIRLSMVKSIAFYIVAFIKREKITPDQAMNLLGITKSQLLELVQSNIHSFDLDGMITLLASVGQYVSVNNSTGKAEVEWSE